MRFKEDNFASLFMRIMLLRHMGHDTRFQVIGHSPQMPPWLYLRAGHWLGHGMGGGLNTGCPFTLVSV